jgi:hypothetical protein
MIPLEVSLNNKTFIVFTPSTLYHIVDSEDKIDEFGSLYSPKDILLSIFPTCNAIIIDATKLDLTKLQFDTSTCCSLIYHSRIPKQSILKIPHKLNNQENLPIFPII